MEINKELYIYTQTKNNPLLYIDYIQEDLLIIISSKLKWDDLIILISIYANNVNVRVEDLVIKLFKFKYPYLYKLLHKNNSKIKESLFCFGNYNADLTHFNYENIDIDLNRADFIKYYATYGKLPHSFNIKKLDILNSFYLDNNFINIPVMYLILDNIMKDIYKQPKYKVIFDKLISYNMNMDNNELHIFMIFILTIDIYGTSDDYLYRYINIQDFNINILDYNNPNYKMIEIFSKEMVKLIPNSSVEMIKNYIRKGTLTDNDYSYYIKKSLQTLMRLIFKEANFLKRNINPEIINFYRSITMNLVKYY